MLGHAFSFCESALATASSAALLSVPTADLRQGRRTRTLRRISRSPVSTMPAHYINRSRSCLAVHCLVYTSSINSFFVYTLSSSFCKLRPICTKQKSTRREGTQCVMCTVYFDEEVSLTALTCWDVYVLRKNRQVPLQLNGFFF